MYLTSIKRPARREPASPHIDWIVDQNTAGAANGRVGVLDLGAGQSAALTPDAAHEQTGFVISGNGTAISSDREHAIESGHTLFVPSGGSLSVHARYEPLMLLVVEADLSARMQDTAATQRRPYIVAAGDIASAPYHNPALGFHHVSARWLVNEALAGSHATIVGQSEFVPNGAHLLHRHDRGEEFFCVLEGEGMHLTEDGAAAMTRGDLVFVPRNEWHGFRNTGDERVRAAFGYLGVGSVDAGGYEVHPAIAQQ